MARTQQGGEEAFGLLYPNGDEPRLTTRGYTGHEHLAESGVIHMNGRAYDPEIGRFMSVDPFIAFPDDGQSFNPYSYVMNNPLKYTDPSGYVAKDTSSTSTNSEKCDDECKKKKAKEKKKKKSRKPLRCQNFVCKKTTYSDGSVEYDVITSSNGASDNTTNSQSNSDDKSTGSSTTNSYDMPLWHSSPINAAFNNIVWNQTPEQSFFDSLSWTDIGALTVPGWDVAACAFSSCSAADWGIAFAGFIPIGKAAKAYKMYDKYDDTVDLYRAVGPEEYFQIIRLNKPFELGPNGSTMKQFGFNFDEVLKYADWQPDYAAILKVTINRKSLQNLDVSKGQIDPMVFKSGVLTLHGAEELKFFNSSILNVVDALE